MKICSNEKKAAAPGSASQRRLKCRLAAAVLLLVISAALMALAAKQLGFAEWYSENIYPLFVNSLGRLWGLFPFSVSEEIEMQTGSGSASSRDQRGADGACGEAAGVCRVVF